MFGKLAGLARALLCARDHATSTFCPIHRLCERGSVALRFACHVLAALALRINNAHVLKPVHDA